MKSSKHFYVTLLVLALGVNSALARLNVSLTDANWKDGKASLSLEASNAGDSAITGARVWIFLMNDDGKVVGNHAEWIIGGKRPEDNPNPSLDAGEESTYEVSFKNEKPFTQARVTFSKLLGEDKKPLNPRKAASVVDKTSEG
ncbi:MAG: hypothetical protein ACPGN3_10250 [Opitutales bacterium]